MIRSIFNSAIRLTHATLSVATRNIQLSHFSNLCAIRPPIIYGISPISNINVYLASNLFSPTTFPQSTTTRTVTKFSLIKGKRKTVRAVIKRFKRLDWGIWIRTHCGRHKKMFKKLPSLKRRLRQHVFTNATQSHLLDKMVTSFWRRPKHYIDDPYAPYHKRDEYFATKSRTFKV